MSNFSAISWTRTNYISMRWWRYLLSTTNKFSWIFIVLAHWNNMLLHSDVFIMIQSLLLHLNVVCILENSKYQFYSLWFDLTHDLLHRTHDLLHLEAIMLTITPGPEPTIYCTSRQSLHHWYGFIHMQLTVYTDVIFQFLYIFVKYK